MTDRLLAALFAGLLGLLVWSAWVVEDAFITLRTVDNFLNGYGLRWNTAERVQTYTHPLWMFALTAGFWMTGEGYYSTVITSTAVSLASAALLAYGLTPSRRTAVVGLLVLITSQAHLDYATAGLENPLTHLLLALFVLGLLRRSTPPWALALIAGLATLNRMDTLLLYAPALWSVFRAGGIRPLLLGFAPFAAWEAFSLLYYGFPFPNTAYAKLYTNVPPLEKVGRGLLYLGESLKGDIITVPTIVAGIAIPWLTRQKAGRPIALGIALYTAYVIAIGGGYMSGRFLTAPFFAALCALCALVTIRTDRALWAAAAAILAADLCAPKSVLLGKAVAQRGDFHRATSLVRALGAGAGTRMPDHPWAERARIARDPANAPDPYRDDYLVVRTERNTTVTTWLTVGFSGYCAGPRVHIVDAYAISDPLLARLPPHRDTTWVSGHMRRIIPDGYIETHVTGENALTDEKLRAYYGHMTSVISGPIFDWRRLATVLRMNLGHYDHLIDAEAYANPSRLDLLRNEVKIRPLPPHRYELAKELFARGDRAGAVRQLERASAARPDHYDNHLRMGHLAFINDATETASALFSHAVTIDSSKIEAHVNLAGTLAKMGKLSEAIRIYRHVLRLEPHNAAAHMLSRLEERCCDR